MTKSGQTCHSLEILTRPAPFAVRVSQPKLRPVLSVAGRWGGATMKRPHIRLPLVTSSAVETLFELPVLSSWELAPGVSTVVVELEREGPESVSVELPLASLHLGDDRDTAHPTFRYVQDHVDAIGEFLFPSTDTGAGEPSVSDVPNPAPATDAATVWRSGGVVAAPWDALHAAFRHDVGRLALIVQVAHYCGDVLHGICIRPRHLLRRERRTTGIDRADQLDEECLRWLVRQPGRTVVEKAGPRQRIRAVRRTHSYDTTENRVVRDFLERCRRLCDAYLSGAESAPEGKRTRDVRVFRRDVKRWLSTSPIGEVPRPVGVPGANYVLQFDDRYRRIWPWYERLRRQQEDEADIRRWRHRSWAEHVVLLMAQAMVTNPNHPNRKDAIVAYRGRCYVRMRAHNGQFVDNGSSYFDSVRCGGERAQRLRVLAVGEGESVLAEVACLAPDGILSEADQSGTPLPGTLVGIWSALVPVSHEPQMAEHGKVLAEELRRLSVSGGCRGILVLPQRRSDGASHRAWPPVAVRVDGAQVLVVSISAPSLGHVPWLRATVAEWLERPG